jgi:hypothetical protein
MDAPYEEHKLSELITREIVKYGLSIKDGSFLKELSENAKKNKEEDPIVYIIDHSQPAKIIECSLTSKDLLKDPETLITRLENCTDKYAPELSADIKYILEWLSRHGIFITLKKSSLDNLPLDKIINLYELNIPTEYGTYLPPTERIAITKDDLSSIYTPLPRAIHEYLQLKYIDSLRILPRIEDEKGINLYEDIIKKYLEPSSSIYKEYNTKLLDFEILTELAMMRIFRNSGIENLLLNAREFIEKSFYQIREKRKEIGMYEKLPKEEFLFARLTAYEIDDLSQKNKNVRETLKDINEIIDEELKSYIEELKR